MPNEVAIKILINYLTVPKYDFYLSKLVLKCNEPKLEPYQSAEISLGKQSIPDLDTVIGITLKNLKIDGISNIEIKKDAKKARITVKGNQVSFYADRPNTESPPAGITQALVINADFIITPDGEEALPPGHLTAQINQAEIAGVFTADSPNDKSDQVVIAFTSLSLQNVVSPGNIKISLQLDSAFEDVINQIIDTPGIHQKLIDGINEKLQAPDVLAALSSGATDAARVSFKKFPGGI